MHTFITVVRAALILFVVLLLTLPMPAQTVSGTLSGRVIDPTGAVVPGVVVVAKDSDTGLVRQAKTDSEGSYLLSFLPLGTYQLTASASGFSTVQKTGVVIDLNKTTVSDFQLKPASVA